MKKTNSQVKRYIWRGLEGSHAGAPVPTESGGTTFLAQGCLHQPGSSASPVIRVCLVGWLFFGGSSITKAWRIKSLALWTHLRASQDWVELKVPALRSQGCQPPLCSCGEAQDSHVLYLNSGMLGRDSFIQETPSVFRSSVPGIQESGERPRPNINMYVCVCVCIYIYAFMHMHTHAHT